MKRKQQQPTKDELLSTLIRKKGRRRMHKPREQQQSNNRYYNKLGIDFKCFFSNHTLHSNLFFFHSLTKCISHLLLSSTYHPYSVLIDCIALTGLRILKPPAENFHRLSSISTDILYLFHLLSQKKKNKPTHVFIYVKCYIFSHYHNFLKDV